MFENFLEKNLLPGNIKYLIQVEFMKSIGKEYKVVKWGRAVGKNITWKKGKREAILSSL